MIPSNGMDQGSKMNGGSMKFMGNGYITINGVNSYEMSSEYVNGEVALKDGRAITEDDLNSNVVMIEETFAEENELEVGDKFTIENVSFSMGSSDEDTEDTISIELEVVGIYKSYEEVSSMGFRDTASLPYNKMIAPYTVVTELNGSDDTEGVDSLLFYINDPANVDAFVEFAENSDIDLDTYSVDAGNKEYESMMEPIENVASFSKTTIVIVSIFGGVILALIIMLTIKSRITEIGILMALGETRIKIIGQLLVEVLITLVIAFGISLAAGSLISDKVANTLVQNEITSISEESSSSTGSMGNGRPTGGMRPGSYMTEAAATEKISELDVSISFNNAMNMGLVALIIVILATIIPSIIIMRYNTKKILSNHS